MKICLVAEFDCPNFFQWYLAFEKHGKDLGVKISTVVANKRNREWCGPDSNFWDPIREADAIFVYCTRIGPDFEWWELPRLVRKIIRKDAVMVTQWDDDWNWVFNQDEVWWTGGRYDWKTPVVKDPQKFFEESKILEVSDANLTVQNNPKFQQYTKKPLYKLLLPQLVRYDNKEKYNEHHKLDNITMMIHSPNNCNVFHTIHNLTKPNKYKTLIFSAAISEPRRRQIGCTYEIMPFIGYDSYLDLLWQRASIAIDDNEGYHGWSRFPMECALAWIPCIGSTDSVKDIFPELYTEHADYKKQKELIERLKNDKAFYHYMVQKGHERCFELLDSKRLCEKLIKIFEELKSMEKV
jgi:hypothetical protein